MSKHVEPNALLLQVMAHDLLSPLTAVKWQTELLQKSGIDARKRTEYLESIAESTALGITLTKHAHVAANVLLGTHKRNNEQTSLAKTVRTAAHELKLQYERHGLSIDAAIHDDEHEVSLDKELLSLLVWAIAKFFLTCTPAQTTVRISGGVRASRGGGNAIYAITFDAPNVPVCEEYAVDFSAQEAKHEYDQTHVFTTLIHTIAPLINATVRAYAEDTKLFIAADIPLSS